jgi:D-lactate dehydrogenase
VGVIGTGKIGEKVARIFKAGFGCNVVAHDLYESADVKALGIPYVPLDDLLAQSDVISVHCPLLPSTFHLLNEERLKKCKRGVMIINTSRGGLIDTPALLPLLQSGHIGSLGLDVIEREDSLFFRDLSNDLVNNNEFNLLTAYPNVLITAHQAFFTKEALKNIADITIGNLNDYATNAVKDARKVTKAMKA